LWLHCGNYATNSSSHVVPQLSSVAHIVVDLQNGFIAPGQPS